MGLIGVMAYFYSTILAGILAIESYRVKNTTVKLLALLFAGMFLKNLYVTIFLFARAFGDEQAYLFLSQEKFTAIWMVIFVVMMTPFAVQVLKQRNGNGN